MDDDSSTGRVRFSALVAFSETGRRVGENHHKARMTDAEVERVWDLHDQGYGTRSISKMIGHPRSTICDVLSCRTRSHSPVRHKVCIVIKRKP